MATKTYYYKGYECKATYIEARDNWLCEVANVTYPFSFESSKESTIQGNFERELKFYIEKCEEKGVAPKKDSMVANAQRGTTKYQEEKARQERKARREQKKFEQSNWKYVIAAFLVGIPALGWLMIASVGRVMPFTLFFPYHAELNTKKIPLITPLVCLLCILVFIGQWISEYGFEQACEPMLKNGHYNEIVGLIEESNYSYVGFCYFISRLSMVNEKTREALYFNAAMDIREDDRDSEWADSDNISNLFEPAIENFDEDLSSPLTDKLMFYPMQNDFFGMYTSVFAHADIWHITFNLIFFFAFALTVELLAGSVFMLVSFLIAPVISAIFYGDHYYLAAAVAETGQWFPMPVLGLSGMCSFFMGALLVLAPKVKIKTFFWYIIGVTSFSIPVWFHAGWFFSFDLMGVLDGASSGVAYISHFVGAILGAFFAFAYKYLLHNHDKIDSMIVEHVEGEDIDEDHPDVRKEGAHHLHNTRIKDGM